MIPENTRSGEARWETLLEQYRDAIGEQESSRNFMPGLWQRIEAKRTRTLRFERAAQSLFAAAVALSLVLGAFLYIPSQQPSVFNAGSFVESLATEDTDGNGTFFEPVRLELTAMEHHRR